MKHITIRTDADRLTQRRAAMRMTVIRAMNLLASRLIQRARDRRPTGCRDAVHVL